MKKQRKRIENEPGRGVTTRIRRNRNERSKSREGV